MENPASWLGNSESRVLRFKGEFHVWLEAPTRAGKGVGVIIPNLLDWLGSVVVLDIKQENYDNTAGYRLKVLGQEVFLFNPLDTTGVRRAGTPLNISIGAIRSKSSTSYKR